MSSVSTLATPGDIALSDLGAGFLIISITDCDREVPPVIVALVPVNRLMWRFIRNVGGRRD